MIMNYKTKTMETGIITEAIRTSRTTKNGAAYYEIRIDDNPIKQMTASKGKIEEGMKINYTVENDYVTIIKDQPEGGGYKNFSKKSYGEPIEHKIIGFALSYAKDCMLKTWERPEKQMTTTQCLKLADIFYDWMLIKSGKEKQKLPPIASKDIKPQKAEPAETKVEIPVNTPEHKDDLPF